VMNLSAILLFCYCKYFSKIQNSSIVQCLLNVVQLIKKIIHHCHHVMSVNLQQTDEQDKVLKRKARFGTITAPAESVSIAVCIHLCYVLCVGLYMLVLRCQVITF